MTYRVEILVTVSGFVRTWDRVARDLTLSDAETRRRSEERNGNEARVRAEDEP
jgi:hypothetical protein